MFDLRFAPASPDTIDFILLTQNTSGTRTSKRAYYNLVNSVGNWYLVAGVYNKTTGEQKLYINGNLVNTQIHPVGNTIVPLISYTDMLIGNSRNLTGFFKGTLDEVYVYKSALSDHEAKDLFNK